MLMGVDLFKNLDSYTTYNVSGSDVLKLTLLYFPEAFLLGLGPSFLFSLTYFLSQLHASNEIICVLNSGIKYRRLLVPCILTGIILSVSYFAFNETVALNSSNRKEVLMKEVTHSGRDNNDNTNIALSDNESGYLVYAANYIDSTKSLLDISFIEQNNDGIINRRIDAFSAQWNEKDKFWTLYEAYSYAPTEDGLTIEITYSNELPIPSFDLEPSLFRNLSAEISRMSIPLAVSYLSKIKNLNPVQYASMGTEFYKRVLSCLTPLIMVIIACCLNYKLKKNVMFFSLLCSICIAVVYYVIQMLTIMLSDQGVIKPAMGMIIPFVCILAITGLLSLFIRN